MPVSFFEEEKLLDATVYICACSLGSVHNAADVTKHQPTYIIPRVCRIVFILDDDS